MTDSDGWIDPETERLGWWARRREAIAAWLEEHLP